MEPRVLPDPGEPSLEPQENPGGPALASVETEPVKTDSALPWPVPWTVEINLCTPSGTVASGGSCYAATRMEPLLLQEDGALVLGENAAASNVPEISPHETPLDQHMFPCCLIYRYIHTFLYPSPITPHPNAPHSDPHIPFNWRLLSARTWARPVSQLSEINMCTCAPGYNSERMRGGNRD